MGRKLQIIKKAIQETTDWHGLGYDTARRLHGGMGGGGMTHSETMSAVKKVQLRTKNQAERDAFEAGALHYCNKSCVKEATMSHAEMADHYDAEVKHLQGRSAAQVAKWYGPNVSPAHAQRAHRNHIAFNQKKADYHRAMAGVKEGFFRKKKEPEVVKSGHWPSIEKDPKGWSKAQHQAREDDKKAAENRRRGLDNNGNSIHGRRR